MANSSQIQLSPLVKAPAGGTQGMNVIRASLRRPPPAAALHGSGAGQRHNQVVNKARVDNKPTAKLKRLFRKQLSALYSLLRAFFCSICPPVCVRRNLSSLHICTNMCERNSQPSWSTHLWRLKNASVVTLLLNEPEPGWTWKGSCSMKFSPFCACVM
jgi:hypothetical protein